MFLAGSASAGCRCARHRARRCLHSQNGRARRRHARAPRSSRSEPVDMTVGNVRGLGALAEDDEQESAASAGRSRARRNRFAAGGEAAGPSSRGSRRSQRRTTMQDAVRAVARGVAAARRPPTARARRIAPRSATCRLRARRRQPTSGALGAQASTRRGSRPRDYRIRRVWERGHLTSMQNFVLSTRRWTTACGLSPPCGVRADDPDPTAVARGRCSCVCASARRLGRWCATLRAGRRGHAQLEATPRRSTSACSSTS